MHIADIIPEQHYKIIYHDYLPGRWNVRMKKYMGRTVKIRQIRSTGGIIIYQDSPLERLWTFEASDFEAGLYHLPNDLFEI